jgi:hypothetical protein
MKRRQLVELEDLPWWPRVWRDLSTDYLAASVGLSKAHDHVAPVLASALRRSGTARVVDLCSGAGGMWPGLLPALRAQGVDVRVTLTDKYPNLPALTAVAATTPGLEIEPAPVSALDVPARLGGFRTTFLAFHHFEPRDARAILASAVRARQGIAVVEGISRRPASLALMAVMPLAVWLLTPFIRPFRWSRLFWTYVVPMVPFNVVFDGVVSCLRVYTPDEMLEMGRAVSGDYEWETGTVPMPGSPIRIPYLIGVPRTNPRDAVS